MTNSDTALGYFMAPTFKPDPINGVFCTSWILLPSTINTVFTRESNLRVVDGYGGLK